MTGETAPERLDLDVIVRLLDASGCACTNSTACEDHAYTAERIAEIRRVVELGQLVAHAPRTGPDHYLQAGLLLATSVETFEGEAADTSIDRAAVHASLAGAAASALNNAEGGPTEREWEAWQTAAGTDTPTQGEVARAEARLMRERDLAVAHDRQSTPTAWAYEQACKALENHRQRADEAEQARDKAEAELARLLGTVTNVKPSMYVHDRLIKVALDAHATWGTGHIDRDMHHVLAAVLPAYKVLADLAAIRLGEQLTAAHDDLQQARLAEQRARDLVHQWKTNGNTALHDQHTAQLLAALDRPGPPVVTSADLNENFDRIAQIVDQFLDGDLEPTDALNAIHEQVGDR